MWTRHVDSSCDLALPGNSSFGLVMWTRHLAARPEINPYQPLLNQLRFPPTSQWVSSRRAPFEPVSSLPTFGMYANLDPTSLAMPPNSSIPSYASPNMPSPSIPYVRLSLLPLFVTPSTAAMFQNSSIIIIVTHTSHPIKEEQTHHVVSRRKVLS